MSSAETTSTPIAPTYWHSIHVVCSRLAFTLIGRSGFEMKQTMGCGSRLASDVRAESFIERRHGCLQLRATYWLEDFRDGLHPTRIAEEVI